MTTKSELIALAERCEAASGADRDLFERAFVASFGKASEGMRPEIAARWIDRWRQFSTFIDVGAWLDAAMTLVPDGFDYTIERDGAWIRWMGEEDIETAQCVLCGRGGKQTALALTAAALRARRARREIDFEADTIVFARGQADQPFTDRNFDDIREPSA